MTLSKLIKTLQEIQEIVGDSTVLIVAPLATHEIGRVYYSDFEHGATLIVWNTEEDE